MASKKDLGQYFTVSDALQQYVFRLVQRRGEPLLEPSFGAGHLLQKFLAALAEYPMVCYEIDESVVPVVSFTGAQEVRYGDFLASGEQRKFATIVGNPPYVKQRGGRNLYIKFIEKCFDLLDDHGEMIMIVPSDFIKLTGAAAIIEKMDAAGSFTDFWFPGDERLFEGAAVDVVVFRYEVGLQRSWAMVDGRQQEVCINKGIITFRAEGVAQAQTQKSLEELFHVYVGIVSGRDEIYKVPFGNVDILVGEGQVERFIFLESFPSGVAAIDNHLEENKDELLARRIKRFTEANWWAWGAPRNLTSIREHYGKPCIYVKNMTRNKKVAFRGEVQLFGGTLLCLVPKEGVEVAIVDRVLEHLNSTEFQKDYMYAGRFKIGHKQVASALLHGK